MHEVLERHGASPDEAAQLVGALRARYSEPHRRYHTVEHLDEVLAEARRLLEAGSAADGDAVVLAAWYHDAVYDPTGPPGSNEEASAALAEAELSGAGVDGRLVGEVARLVRLTADHRVDAGDDAAAILVDADLAVLAATPERYSRYLADVRAEYAAVDDDAWRAGRAAVLERFLADPHLFHTGTDLTDRRRRARANMTEELAALTSAP